MAPRLEEMTDTYNVIKNEEQIFGDAQLLSKALGDLMEK